MYLIHVLRLGLKHWAISGYEGPTGRLCPGVYRSRLLLQGISERFDATQSKKTFYILFNVTTHMHKRNPLLMNCFIFILYDALWCFLNYSIFKFLIMTHKTDFMMGLRWQLENFDLRGSACTSNPGKKSGIKTRVGERNKRVGVGVVGGVGLVFLVLPPHPGVQLLFASDASAGLDIGVPLVAISK